MTFPAPRAVGVRLPYHLAPASLRRWVEVKLGVSVVEARTQIGGMSPGCAARLRLSDGGRAFLKAVGDDLNTQTPTLFRHEIEVLAHLGPAPYRPSVLATYDDGAWVGLLLEDISGRHPDFSAERDTDAVWATVAQQARELTPPPRGLRIPTLADNAERWAESWAGIATGADCLPPWAAERVEVLRARVTDLPDRLPVEALCHWDIRDDNLLVRRDGSVVIVDWGMARLGPRWGDLFALSLEWVDTPEFDRRMAMTDADAVIVTDLLLSLGGHGAFRATEPAPRGLPTLGLTFERDSPACLGTDVRLTGWFGGCDARW